VLVYPSGGLLPIRAWPLASYLKLCEALLRDGYAIAVIGLKQDKSVGQAIVAHCRNPACIDLTGYTATIRHLLALFHRAALLVTNDGGPGQFAVLTPVPTIILFGPETPLLYGPLSKNAFCFHLGLPCSPCLTAYNHRNSPCDGDNQCLKRITPEQVLAQARKMMAS
jgi:ADP-heptose:LPS heptosyltransferase